MKVLKDWIIAHKLLSIIIATVIVVGTASAVVLPIALAHKHEFSAEWTSDADSHWHACAGKDCEEVDGKADHVYDNACDATCNVCGKTRTVEDHKFVTRHDETKHWQECSECEYKKDEEEHYLDSVAEEGDTTHKLKCSRCDYITGDLPHSINTYYDSKNHWQECDDCNYTTADNVVAHTFVPKHDDTDHWEECSVCGYKKGKTAHVFVTERSETKHWLECSCGCKKDEAEHTFETAHNGTEHWEECSECDYAKDEAAHVFEPKRDETNHWLECSCGYKKDEAAHDLETKRDATKHWLECSCGYKKDEAEHDYGAWSEKTAADYGVDKVETRSCSKCSYVDERTVAKSRLEYTGDFYMMITGVNNVTGKGVIVSGTVARGTVKENDEVSIGGYEGTLIVKAIEIDKTTVKEATYGDVISVLLGTDVSKDDIKVGQPMYKPGTLTQHTTFTAEIYLKTEAEGGRKTAIFSGYNPEFNFNGLSIAGTITLPEGKTALSPGETATVTVVLTKATYLRENVTFTAQEKTKTVITGRVLHVAKLTGDSEGHWTVCADCGITLGTPEEKAEHYFSWVQNSETHYQKCDDCGYTTDEEEHTYESDEAIECDDCLRQRDTVTLAFKSDMVYTAKTYNGEVQVFDKSVLVETDVPLDDVIVEYSATKTEPNWITNPKDAGTYYIRLRVVANNDHTGLSVDSLEDSDKVLTIAAKTLDITDLVLAYTPNDLRINPTTVDLKTADIPGICDNDTLKVSLAYKSGTKFSSGDVYTVEVKNVFATTHAEKYVTVQSMNTNYIFNATSTGKLYVVDGIISYNDEREIFLSESVDFNSGETKLFVIELTDKMIDDYNNEISGSFVVDSKSETLTLTVSVYDSNGDIENDATSGAGTLYLEGLTAGKYFIKVTANEACSGYWSVSFA